MQIPGSTLTLWSSFFDYVNIVELMSTIEAVGKERIYIDVPEGLRCQIVHYENMQSSTASYGRNRRVAAAAVIAFLTYLTCAASYKPWTYQKFVRH